MSMGRSWVLEPGRGKAPDKLARDGLAYERVEKDAFLTPLLRARNDLVDEWEESTEVHSPGDIIEGHHKLPFYGNI
jgi:hypothetical protein